MVSYRYLGSALTNANGVATFDYEGTGAGEIDVIASLDKPITDGSIVSETLPVLDTLLYDTGTDATHNIWAGDTSNLTRGTEYSTLREAELGTTTRIVTQLPQGLWFLNMKVRRDGSSGNFNFEVIHNNTVIFGWATPTNEEWADLKLVYDGTYMYCYINDNPTPARKERVYIDETKNTYFRLQTPQSITYVDFKDLLVFREGASSISIGSSTPGIIQSGDTATINGSLYENGLIVQNATLDVYKNGTKVGTASTGSTGVASYSYVGTGVGECEFQFKYGSISSEPYTVWDTYKWDTGTINSHNDIWDYNSATTVLTRYDEYSSITEKVSGTDARMYCKNLPTSATIDIELCQIDGSIGNGGLNFYDNESYRTYFSLQDLGYTSSIIGQWVRLRITYGNGSFTATSLDDPTKTVTKSYNNNITSLSPSTNGTMTEHRFRNMKVYSI